MMALQHQEQEMELQQQDHLATDSFNIKLANVEYISIHMLNNVGM